MGDAHERGGPRKGRPQGLATTLDRADSKPEQLTLWAHAIPAHPLAPPEWHLRRFVNTQPRSRPHWWIADLRRRSA
jgi:hypothetical protein